MCSSNIVYYKKQQQKDTEEFIAGNHALKEADSEENFVLNTFQLKFLLLDDCTIEQSRAACSLLS